MPFLKKVLAALPAEKYREMADETLARDVARWLAKSRLGIHVDLDSIMISTPLDKFEADVYGLAEQSQTEPVYTI
jgi:hypothetical protein